MTVCLCLTRNIYEQAKVAVHSIRKHNPNCEIIVFAEDDHLDWADKTINLLSIKDDVNPNYASRWTYMAMTRLYLHRLLPLKKVIYVDYDIVCLGSLKGLWKINLDGYDVGMVSEPAKSSENNYYNSGVMLMNLENLRKGNGDKCIEMSKKETMTYPDQDLINKYYKIKEIDRKWNMGLYTGNDKPENSIIYHYMGVEKPWQYIGGRYEVWHKEEAEIDGKGV